MIGHGRYHALTKTLEPDAEKFSAQLQRACGAILVWHRQRRVWCVVRKRGDHAPPMSFFDITRSDLPFSSSMLRYAVDAVKHYDARAAGDPTRIAETARKIERQRWEAERESFIAAYVPEFIKGFARMKEIVSDGRFRPKFFDMAGKRLRASA